MIIYLTSGLMKARGYSERYYIQSGGLRKSQTDRNRAFAVEGPANS